MKPFKSLTILLHAAALATGAFILCQCAQVKHTVAPLVNPQGERFLLTTKSKAAVTEARPSQFMAAFENLDAGVRKGAELVPVLARMIGAVAGAGPQPAAAKRPGAGVSLACYMAVVRMKSGERVVAAVPFVDVITIRVPQERIKAEMAAIQRIYYRKCAEECPIVPVSQIRPQLPARP